MDDKLLNSNLNYENYDDYIEKIFNIFRLSSKNSSIILSIDSSGVRNHFMSG